MAAPQYTTCVKPEDYQDLDLTVEEVTAAVGVVGAIIATVAAGPAGQVVLFVSLVAGMSALLKFCDYELGGKLVCLGSDECGIGRVTTFETVDNSKSEFGGLAKIDNDYCINLLLSPHDLLLPLYLTEFERGDTSNHRLDNYKKVARDHMQGRLITEQKNADGTPLMPVPREGKNDPKDSPSERYGAYETWFSNYTFGDSIVDPPSTTNMISVPVLHTEIEGNRLYYVCTTLSALGNPIPGFCSWKPLGIPIGHWVCSIVLAALAPIVLAALATAWALGSDDNRDFAGYLVKGDQVLIYGRWVFDAGHHGNNELHAVKGLQKLDPIKYWSDFNDAQDFMNWHDRWCRLISEAPPGYPPTGESAQALTAEQQQVQDQQQQPANRWIIHPLLDGCMPPEGQSGTKQPT